MRKLDRILGRTFTASLIALAACSEGGGRGWGSGSDDGGVGADDGFQPGGTPDLTMKAQPDLAMASYPAGPYGKKTGDTLGDFASAGYRLSPQETDSSNLMWDTTIRLANYHNNKQCKCLLITMGARWCGPCKQEQPKLVQAVDSDPEFCVMGVLQEGNSMAPASRNDVDAWTATFHQNFFVTQGNIGTSNILKAQGGTIGLPFNLIVDPRSMEILEIVQGYDPQIHAYARQTCGL
ncbi:MAG: hypothetical protein EXR72_08705 [Myxococcales bacterium]|nr:hypothetical protein [Myxococcales bacterium]